MVVDGDGNAPAGVGTGRIGCGDGDSGYGRGRARAGHADLWHTKRESGASGQTFHSKGSRAPEIINASRDSRGMRGKGAQV